MLRVLLSVAFLTLLYHPLILFQIFSNSLSSVIGVGARGSGNGSDLVDFDMLVVLQISVRRQETEKKVARGAAGEYCIQFLELGPIRSIHVSGCRGKSKPGTL